MPDMLTIAPAEANLIYAGKAKRIHATANPDEVLIDYSDAVTAGNGDKRGTITGKGAINNTISAAAMRHLESCGVATHFIEQVGATTQLARRVEIVPLEVVVRNRAWGSLVRRTGIERGTILRPPISEFFLKDDDLGDPLVNRQHIDALGIAGTGLVEDLETRAREINALLADWFAGVGLELVDGKYEFGHAHDGSLVLADEISPDTLRLHDIETGDSLDKDRFRNDLGNIDGAYETVLDRIAQREAGA